MSPDTIRISVIIPAYNEEAYLPRLLDTVDRARARYRGNPDAIEYVVGDNASTDRTADVARARGCVVVPVAKRVISAARNGAAAQARGEIFLFCDADLRIHPETFNVVDKIVGSDKFIGGVMGERPEKWSVGVVIGCILFWPLLVYFFFAGMGRGPFFCTREDFDALGRYDESMYWMEDQRILRDLAILGRKRGQRVYRGWRAMCIQSKRKREQFGDFESIAAVFKMIWWQVIKSSEAKRLRAEWVQRRWYRSR